MREYSPRKGRSPDEIDVELAADADLNDVWEEEGKTKTPRARVTVGEALVAQSRPLDPDDLLPHSRN